MSTANPSNDRRESFRCPIEEPRERSVLRVGANTLPCRLLDESAGGFSVLLDGPVDLGADQIAELHSDAGSFEVRVIHATDAAPLKDGDTNDSQEESASRFRVGLLRLREIPPDEPSLAVFARNRRLESQPSCAADRLHQASSLLLLLAMVALPLGLVAMIWYAGRSVAANTSDDAEFAPSPSGFGMREFVVPSGADEALQGPTAKGRETLRESADRLWKNVALIPPEAARHLHLTEDQQEKIHRLENVTAEAIHLLNPDPKSHVQDWRNIVERRAAVLDHARTEVLKLLTDQQRAQLDGVFAEPP